MKQPVLLVSCLAILVLLATGVHLVGPGGDSDPLAACPATEVNRPTGTVTPVPAVSVGEDIEALLFYYADGAHGDATFIEMAPGGRTSSGLNTKVLWIVDGATSESLSVNGKRLDREGAFSAEFPRAASPANHFPSVVRIPSPGCWRLSVSAGDARGAITVLATHHNG